MLTITPAYQRHRCLSATLPQLLLFLQKPIFLLVLLQYSYRSFPQTTDLLYKLDYKKTETTYYMIADTSYKFSGPELVKLKRQIKIDSVIREVDLNHDITTSIYHLKDTQLEDWMTHPAKTVINNESTIVYNAQDEVLVKSEHSDAYLNNYNQLKTQIEKEQSDIIPTYIYVTPEMINAFVQNGLMYSDRGQEGIYFTNDTIEIILNDDELTDELRIYSTDGVMQYDLKHGYTKNEFGQIVPSFTISKMWDERFTANCIRKIVVTNFDGYKITYPEGNREVSSELALGEVTIFPNPVGDFLNVKLPADYFKTATIEIMDETGAVMLSKFLAEVQIDLTVPIAGLNTGFYFLRMFDGTKEINKNFYKN